MRVSFIFFIFLFSVISCGPKAFVKGDYDDAERQNLMNDEWSETDMQNAARDLVSSLIQHPAIANAKAPPVLMITQLQNKTSEHIDTQNIMDMVRVELMKTGKMTFRVNTIIKTLEWLTMKPKRDRAVKSVQIFYSMDDLIQLFKK